MRPYRCALFTTALAVAGASHTLSLDMAHVTCRGFLASGSGNMQAIIMWLRGYHAGKMGIVARLEIPEMRTYGAKLGYYCKTHPNLRVIDASEKILTEKELGL